MLRRLACFYVRCYFRHGRSCGTATSRSLGIYVHDSPSLLISNVYQHNMITASSKKPLLSSLLLLGIASAQLESIEQNPVVDILSCGDLSCIDSNSGSVCQSNATLETGLGIASGDVSIPGSDSPLSLTLVDGYPLGDLAYTGAWLTTQTLYAGVPANFNASGQNDACALMLQYQAQTLPEDEALARNTTSCDSTISSGLQRVLTNMIQSFDYSAYGSSNNTLPRCEALTQHFNAEIHSRQVTLKP